MFDYIQSFPKRAIKSSRTPTVYTPEDVKVSVGLNKILTFMFKIVLSIIYFKNCANRQDVYLQSVSEGMPT